MATPGSSYAITMDFGQTDTQASSITNNEIDGREDVVQSNGSEKYRSTRPDVGEDGYTKLTKLSSVCERKREGYSPYTLHQSARTLSIITKYQGSALLAEASECCIENDYLLRECLWRRLDIVQTSAVRGFEARKCLRRYLYHTRKSWQHKCIESIIASYCRILLAKCGEILVVQDTDI